MSAFFDAVLSLPTVLFTVPLVLVVLYWTLVLLGIFDAGEGVEGAFEGAAEVAVEAALDPEALAGGEGGGCLGGVLGSLGLVGVPVTLSFSLLTFFGWLASLGGTWLVDRVGLASVADVAGVADVAAGGALALVLSAGVALGALALGVVFTAWAIRPLKPFFAFHGAAQRRDFVGKVCTVRTSGVNDSFGQAEIEDGGAGLLVEVRCREEGERCRRLERGSKALIFDYDAEQEVFLIVPADGPIKGAPVNKDAPSGI